MLVASKVLFTARFHLIHYHLNETLMYLLVEYLFVSILLCWYWLYNCCFII